MASQDEDDSELEMEEAIASAVEELWRRDGAGDVLVFLPGEREIRETAEELRRAKLRDAEILPLFARSKAGFPLKQCKRSPWRIVLPRQLSLFR